MKNMKKKLMTLITSVMATVMVLGTSITANAAGVQFEEGLIPTGTTPGGVIVYGYYHDEYVPGFITQTGEFPQEYLLAIDAAGITNEMSAYEKCTRINDYLCAVAEYGRPEKMSQTGFTFNDTMTLDQLLMSMTSTDRTGNVGLDILRYGKGVCCAYTDAFQTMTSMVGVESYSWTSGSMNHAWNSVIIDGITYYTDVTWNDYLNNNCYLMSTELWADHVMADTIPGTLISSDWEIEFIGW